MKENYRMGAKFITDSGRIIMLCVIDIRYVVGEPKAYLTYSLICVGGTIDIGNRFTNPFESNQCEFTIDELLENCNCRTKFTPINSK